MTPGAFPAFAERVVTLGAQGSGSLDEAFRAAPGPSKTGASATSSLLARERDNLTSLLTSLMRSGDTFKRYRQQLRLCWPRDDVVRLHPRNWPSQPSTFAPYG